MLKTKSVLVIGGSNFLEQAFIQGFHKTWNVANLDSYQNPAAPYNILFNENPDFSKDIDRYVTSLTKFSPKIDAIICCTEAHAFGSFKDPNILNIYEYMRRCNFLPALVGKYTASLIFTL